MLNQGDSVRIDDPGGYWDGHIGEVEDVDNIADTAAVKIELSYGTVHQMFPQEVLQKLTLEPVLPKGKHCLHDLAEYNSGWTSYKYCKKCNQKMED